MKILIANTLYIIEAFFFILWILFCKLLGINYASLIGGKLAKLLGPLTNLDKRALNNLKKIFPHYTEAEIDKIKFLGSLTIYIPPIVLSLSVNLWPLILQIAL